MTEVAAIRKALAEKLGTTGWSVHDGAAARLHPPTPPVPGDMVMIQRDRDDTPSGWTYLDNGWCFRVWHAHDTEWPPREPTVILRPAAQR